MVKEAAQFDEDFGAVPIRATPALAAPPAPTAGPLSADDLGALLCRVPYTDLASGEQGEIVLSADDWRMLIERHHLEIRRTS